MGHKYKKPRQVKIGKNSYFGKNLRVIEGHSHCVQIGEFCSLAADITFCMVTEHNYRRVTTYPVKMKVLGMEYGVDEPRVASKGDVIVGNDVWIGYGATILSGVNIGHGAIIAAYALVTKDVEPYAIVGGNPAKVIKYRFEPHQIEALLDIAWWNWSIEVLSERCDDVYMEDIDEFIAKYKN